MRRRRIHDIAAIVYIVVFVIALIADNVTWVSGNGSQPSGYAWFGVRLSWGPRGAHLYHDFVGLIGAVSGVMVILWLFKTYPRSWRRVKVLFTRRRLGKCRK